jgi:hypothetical protein
LELRAVFLPRRTGTWFSEPGRFAQQLAGQLSNALQDFAVAALARLEPRFNIHLEARENWGRMIGARIDRLIMSETNAEDIYNRFVRESLEEFASTHPQAQVSILVDALDEAMTAATSATTVPTTIVDLLAGSMDFAPNLALCPDQSQLSLSRSCQSLTRVPTFSAARAREVRHSAADDRTGTIAPLKITRGFHAADVLSAHRSEKEP